MLSSWLVSFFVGFFCLSFQFAAPEIVRGRLACAPARFCCRPPCGGALVFPILAASRFPPCHRAALLAVASLLLRCGFSLSMNGPEKIRVGSRRGPGTLFFLSFSASLVVRCVSRFRRCRGVSVLCLNPLTMHKYTKNIDTVNTQSKIFSSFLIENVNT